MKYRLQRQDSQPSAHSNMLNVPYVALEVAAERGCSSKKAMTALEKNIFAAKSGLEL